MILNNIPRQGKRPHTHTMSMWAPSFPPISLTQLLPPLKPVVPEFERLGVFADDAFFGFGESFRFGGVDVQGDFKVSTAAG